MLPFFKGGGNVYIYIFRSCSSYGRFGGIPLDMKRGFLKIKYLAVRLGFFEKILLKMVLFYHFLRGNNFLFFSPFCFYSDRSGGGFLKRKGDFDRAFYFYMPLDRISNMSMFKEE